MATDLNLIDSVIEDAIEDIENSSVSVDDESIAIFIKFKKSSVDLNTEEDSIAIRKTLEYIQLMSFGGNSQADVLNEIETVVFDINATFDSYRIPLYFLYLINKAFSGSIVFVTVSRRGNEHTLYPEQLHKTHDMFMRTHNRLFDKVIFNAIWSLVIVPFYKDEYREKPIKEIYGEQYGSRLLSLYNSYLVHDREEVDDECLWKFIGMDVKLDYQKLYHGNALIASFHHEEKYEIPEDYKNTQTTILATKTFFRERIDSIKTKRPHPPLLHTIVLLRQPYLKGDNLWISYCSVYYVWASGKDDFSEDFWNCFTNIIIS